MTVIKRTGKSEKIYFDKIVSRLENLGLQGTLQINYVNLAIKVIDQLYDGIRTSQIDELSAQQCASLATTHSDYGILASRILISNHHKNTSSSMLHVAEALYSFRDIHDDHYPLVSEQFLALVQQHEQIIESMIDYERDFLFDYFGFKTLERAYLMRIRQRIVERPQHMWMRVSLCIHGDDLEKVRETYNFMSLKYFTHATPTLFNAGTTRPQLSSCYLLAMESDSIDGIYNTLKDCASISKWAGGIGLHIHNIRGSGSFIRGTNGTSNGIVPMLRVYNTTARYVDQGGGKRNGSFAVYLEPWHSDIELFLEMRKSHGEEEMRARDLFFALWIPDLFMQRVQDNKSWTLMCPDQCPGLSDVYGEKFASLYVKYEQEDRGKKKILARDLWFKILDSQIETGTPYMLYKDAANYKSNQKNLGTIKSSNLCTEIIEYSDDKETAVCNLASVALNKFVREDKSYNYAGLHGVVKVITRNLNKVIDINFYPTEKTKRSNLLHRPIGVGVQGLADVFALMDVPFESEAAKDINKLIFETLYHAALEESNGIAEERHEGMRSLILACGESHEWEFSSYLPHARGYKLNNPAESLEVALNTYKPIYNEVYKLELSTSGAYSSFEGSPASKGELQFDMWGITPGQDRYDWEALKANIKRYGLRNSLLLAPMPTASTSQILGNNECIEPFTSNIYVRRTNAGEFVMVNSHLQAELLASGKWSNDLKNSIIAHNGSVQHLDMPDHFKDKYKTAWEMSNRHIIDMSKDRGAFICQSQSLNLWVEDPTYANLTAMHFHAWNSGLKTGLYYLRTRAKAKPQQFTIEPTLDNLTKEVGSECEMCSA